MNRFHVSLLLFPLVALACSGSPADSGGDGDLDSDSDAGSGGTSEPGDGDGDLGSGGQSASGGAGPGAGGAGTGTGGIVGVSGPLSMGYILDLEQWGGTAALDLLDYTAADYVIHAFYTGNAVTGAVESVDPIVDAYRDAGLVTKVHAAGRKIVMSLGGAVDSYPLKQIAANPTLRATFVQNVVSKINEWGYDGVDLDLEFPAGGSEPDEHLALMTELHNAVKANNPAHLTMFGISPGYWIDQFRWASLGAVADYGFYFCYDWDLPANGPMKNPGVNFTALGGAMFEASCSGAMNYMIAQGFPASQIIVGLPFYANGGAHYSAIPEPVKTVIPHADYMEAQDPSDLGAWWPNVASTEMKMDAVLSPASSVLTGGAVAAGVGWWEWGYENPASPDLSQAIKAKLGN